MIPHEQKPKKKKKKNLFCIGTSSCRMIWIKPEKSRIKSRISNEFKPCQF